MLDYTDRATPANDAAARSEAIKALLLTAGTDVALAEAKKLYRNGNPWPYTELQWGVCLTGEEYAEDDRERDEWDSGRRGRFFVLESYQRDLHENVCNPLVRQVIVKGASGVGKGASAGMTIVAYFDCWDDAKVAVTRDTYETAVNLFLPEITKWWMAARVPPRYKWSTTEVGTKAHFIRAANPRTNEGFSGMHGMHVLFVFDEATAVPQARWNMADTQAKKFLALGNPRFSYGPFRDMFPRHVDPDVCQTIAGPSGLRRLITCRGMDASNVRMRRLDAPVAPPRGITIGGREYKPGEPIAPEHQRRVQIVVPGQIDLAKYHAITGNDDPAFVAYMGFGQFPGEDREFSLYPRAGLDMSVAWWQRWQALKSRSWWRTSKLAMRQLEKILPVTAFGLDVARSNEGQGDESFLAAGGRRGIRALHGVELRDVVKVARWAMDTAQDAYGIDLRRGVVPVAVDGVGVGGGVVDVLKGKGVRVIEVMGGSTANDSAKYFDRRSELFGEGAERVSATGGYFGWQWLPKELRDPGILDRGIPFALPNDPKLLEELGAIERLWEGRNKEKMRVTPKDAEDKVEKHGDTTRVIRSLKKRLGRSPDRADAFSLLMAALEEAPADLNRWLGVMG